MAPVQKLLLLTTVAATERLPLLDRLVASVAASAWTAGATVDHRILLQSGIVYQAPATPWQYDLTLLQTGDSLSLSAARNRLLASVDLTDVQTTILAFPDDDAWFPPGLIPHLLDRFSMDPPLDLWICQYGSHPVAPEPRLSVPADFAPMLRHASSNTIVLRADVAARIGGFVEALGVGTPVPGGEDTEYAIRAFAQSRAVELMPLRCVGHRDANAALRSRYYIGGLAALAYNLRGVPGCRRALLRKLPVGIYHVLTGRMAATTLVRAWRHAADVARAGA